MRMVFLTVGIARICLFDLAALPLVCSGSDSSSSLTVAATSRASPKDRAVTAALAARAALRPNNGRQSDCQLSDLRLEGDQWPAQTD